MSLHRCDNCNTTVLSRDLKPVKDLDERVDENGRKPSGECPECGALAYEVHSIQFPLQTFVTMVQLAYAKYGVTAGELVEIDADEESGDLYAKWSHDMHDYAQTFHNEYQDTDEKQKVVHVENGTTFWLVDSEGCMAAFKILQPVKVF